MIITSSLQMVLDVLGDLLSMSCPGRSTSAPFLSFILVLVFPIRLVWKIRIPWTQKLALLATLGLSLIMIGTSGLLLNSSRERLHLSSL